MNTYKNQPFFKLVLRFGLIFLVVITVLKIVFGIFKTGGISGTIDQYFSEDRWIQFVKIQLVISAIYGLFMAGYYKFIKK
jgi:hypothetical protein